MVFKDEEVLNLECPRSDNQSTFCNMSESNWEDIFCRWAIGNDVIQSNVDMANLSNINRAWRNAVKKSIILESKRKRSNLDCSMKKQLLLLPSMVKRLLTGTPNTETLVNVSVDGFPICEEYQDDHIETFCAAWFPSEGIQVTTLDTLSDDETAGMDDVSLVRGVAPSSHGGASSVAKTSLLFGSEVYDRSDDDHKSRHSVSSRKQRHRVQKNRTPPRQNFRACDDNISNDKQEGMSCEVCAEWRGLRSAVEVLVHFGFAERFVTDVLDTTFKLVCDQNDSESNSQFNPDSFLAPGFAVRGAIIARPDRYCLCHDKQSMVTINGYDDISLNHSCSILKSQCLSLSDDSEYSSSDEDQTNERVAIRIEEYKLALLRRERRRKDLQRDVIPRTLLADSGSSGRKRRCVQFLNSSGSHAVCMVTPPFACGPISEPVTIFCVGVATEDGCFMSGLHRRFEIGHLYPPDDVSRVTEMSSVCISTEVCDDKIDTMNAITNQQQRICSYKNSECYHSSSDGSRDEGSLHKRVNCDCIFHLNRERANESDDENSRYIHRGLFGPGSWHCYTAVVDGMNSLVRVDGISEPMTHKTEYGQEGSLSKGIAMLDGLTIGSDHCFGMSLCCGNGSGGEGEGAIAELIVFSGRLDERDLCAIELQLMSKHGICCNPSGDVSVASCKKTRSENSWTKQAHAILVAGDISEMNSDHDEHPLSVPLRFLARHRSVAWQYNNAVTGKRVRTPRIGCPSNEDSCSDW